MTDEINPKVIPTTETPPVVEPKVEAPKAETDFKTFKTQEEYDNAVKSERSKAKNEVLKEMGIKSVDEVKEKLTQVAALQTELTETKTKFDTLNEDYSLSKAGIQAEYREEVLTLARAKTTAEVPLDKAIEAVVEKMPFVAGKAHFGNIGKDKGKAQVTPEADAMLKIKYPFIKG